MGFEFLTAIFMKGSVFWRVTTSSLLIVNQSLVLSRNSPGDTEENDSSLSCPCTFEINKLQSKNVMYSRNSLNLFNNVSSVKRSCYQLRSLSTNSIFVTMKDYSFI
jgi:hypothetical protein